MKTHLSRNAIIGYPAGIITGIAYGLNPLFAVPLMNDGASVVSILFFRYIVAVALLGVYLAVRRQSFSVTWQQAGVLLVLGLLFTSSSMFLFLSYEYIASGLATTLVFLFPVIVAIIMVFLRVVPSWPVWLAIAATFAGVVIMTRTDSTQAIDPRGVFFSLGSAFVYALFLVIINRSKTIGTISNTLLTFYALSVGAVVFIILLCLSGAPVMTGFESNRAWLNIVGLALLPTIISMSTLAVATRNIGATKASVLSVFEPITAILVGTLVFNEPLTVNIVIGIAISIVAVTFMIAATKR